MSKSRISRPRLRTIWVVEIYHSVKQRWETTFGIGLTREEARDVMRLDWKINFPKEKFRVVPYTTATRRWE